MTGRQGQGESKTSPRRLAGAELEVTAFKLRKQGWTYDAIGEECCVTRQSAHKAVQRALAKLPPIPELTDFRRIELERSDDLIAAMWPRVEAGEPEAVRAVVRIMERRARLAGSDVLPSLNAVSNDVVQGVLDSLIGLAVRMLGAEQRQSFLAQVETTLLQIEAPRGES